MTRKRDDTPEQPNSQSGRDRQTDGQMKGVGTRKGETWEQRHTWRVLTKLF